MVLSFSEKESAKIYNDFLHSTGIESIYECGEDPPDFKFNIADTSVAVEVTELHKYVEDDGSEVSQIKMWSSLERICSKVQKELGKSLNRKIKVCLTVPLSRKERSQLATHITSYVTRNSIKEEKLFGKENCWISSEQSDPEIALFMGTSGKTMTPGTRITSADIQANIDYSIRRILEAKVIRLEQLTYYEKRILLIYSSHFFGSLERVQIAMDRFKPLPELINNIYLIERDRINEVNLRT